MPGFAGKSGSNSLENPSKPGLLGFSGRWSSNSLESLVRQVYRAFQVSRAQIHLKVW